MRRRIYLAAIVAGLLLACGFVGTRLMGAGDAVLDGKRKLADDLFRNGKFNEAATMLKEVIAADASQFRDHLRLARSYEKLNQTQEALAEYHKVMDLLPDNPAATTEEKLAKGEASQKVKIMDAFATKVDATIDEFFHKMEALEREAETANNVSAQDRIGRLLGMLSHLEHRRDRGWCEVSATQDWQDSGVILEAGAKYQFTAKGTWSVEAGRPKGECSADGNPNYPGFSVGGGRMGQLMGSVGKKEVFPLGQKGSFVPKTSGPLFLSINDSEKGDNGGTIEVLIRKQ